MARPHRVDRTMVALLGFAFVVRVSAIFAFPSLHHPDENFQLFEAAHRLAFGYGEGTWEFGAGMRSLVLPYLISKVFLLAEPIFGGPKGYIYSAQILLAGLSLFGVAAVYRMGLRTSRTHALLVGIVAATWFEIVYFSFRPLTEAVSFDFLLISLSLATVPPKELSWQRLALIGLCMGVSFMLRIQMLPGLVFLAAWIARLSFRERWAPLIFGAAPALLVFGLADWIAWGSPFHSYIAAIQLNLLEGKASTFGTFPALWYFKLIAEVWSVATPAILGLVAIRARSSALWLGVAACIVAGHSLIPHKEYRFIFPATACLVLIAAMGSADLMEKLQARLGPRWNRSLLAGGAALWAAASASLAFSEGFSYQWFRAGDLIRAEYWLAAQPDLCGLLIYDRGLDYLNSAFDSGAYTHLHRQVPLKLLGHQPETAAAARAFNFVILSRSSLADFPGYALVGCAHDVCIIKRPGSCFQPPE